MVEKEPNRMLISALNRKPNFLNLSFKDLTFLPPTIGKIDTLQSLVLKNNNLIDLPPEISCLQKLKNLNIGNNQLRHIPSVLSRTHHLSTLHLFNNDIEFLNPHVLCGLHNLTILNLNNNKLTEIPPEINRICHLQYLILDNNKIEHLPSETCHLSELQELNVNNNKLQCFPKEIAFLKDLIRLRLRKNKLEELPEDISQCRKLELLDVAGNYIRCFPSGICEMRLKEIHCEENNLVKRVPVRCVQEQEALTLKETSARLVLKELNNPKSTMQLNIKYFPDAENLLELSSKCAFCDGPFLNTWLECVQFIDSKKIMKTRNNAGVIPVRALLCSYECFNNQVGHEYFGIAKANLSV